jgi:hypothetical protein
MARRLLVPEVSVRALPPTADSVFALHHQFDVSLEVAARALADVQSLSVALWYWSSGASRSPESLIWQWGSLESPAREHHWQFSQLAAAALRSGAAAGSIDDLGRLTRATSRADSRRRQLVLVSQD